jgi:hypothetical protein
MAGHFPCALNSPPARTPPRPMVGQTAAPPHEKCPAACLEGSGVRGHGKRPKGQFFDVELPPRCDRPWGGHRCVGRVGRPRAPKTHHRPFLPLRCYGPSRSLTSARSGFGRELANGVGGIFSRTMPPTCSIARTKARHRAHPRTWLAIPNCFFSSRMAAANAKRSMSET